MTFPLAGIPGGYELWIILAILLLLFGRRIPQVARSLGQGISQFKQGLSDPDADLADEKNGDEAKADKPKASTSEKPKELSSGEGEGASEGTPAPKES